MFCNAFSTNRNLIKGSALTYSHVILLIIVASLNGFLLVEIPGTQKYLPGDYCFIFKHVNVNDTKKGIWWRYNSLYMFEESQERLPRTFDQSVSLFVHKWSVSLQEIQSFQQGPSSTMTKQLTNKISQEIYSLNEHIDYTVILQKRN